MKRTSTLLLAIFAMTLITASLLTPFASAHNGKRALRTIDLPGSIDTRSFGISPAREIVGRFMKSAPDDHADLRPSSEPVRKDPDAFGGPPLSIAFHSNSVGMTEVYVMNPDGTDQTRLTFDPRTDQQPDISPDGRQIVF